MPSILFTDHPLCELMAEKAMHDPIFKLQLEKSAFKKDPRMIVPIEKDMAKLRHKLLMLSKIKDRTHQPRRGTLNAQVNGESKRALISAGRAPANSRRALTILAANQRLQTDPKPFPILRLPLEIRQQIYEELLRGTNREVIIKSFDVSAFKEDYPNRGIETFYGNRASPHWRNPVSTFENATPNIYGKDITTGLLLVSKAMYAETVPILYQSHTFDFGIDVFGIVPLLRKMTPLARQNVRNIHMEYYALPTHVLKRPIFQHHWHVRDNTQDWTEACAYIADHLQLKDLSINVNMKSCKPGHPPVDLSLLHWVKELVQIQGLRSLSHHVSPSGHGLEAVAPRKILRLPDSPSEGFSPGPDDVVDGDVKGAKPGLGKLFRYLRGEMLESTKSGPGADFGV